MSELSLFQLYQQFSSKSSSPVFFQSTQPHFFCQNPNHTSPSSSTAAAQIILICLQPQCTNQRKCCLYCVDQLHSKHELVSLKCLLKDMQRYLQPFSNNKQKEQPLNINSDKQKTYQLLNQAREYFQAQFQHLRSALLTRVSVQQDKILNYLNVLYELLGISQHETVKAHLLAKMKEEQEWFWNKKKEKQKNASINANNNHDDSPLLMNSNNTLNYYINLMKKSRSANLGSFEQTQTMYIYNTQFFLDDKFVEAQLAIQNTMKKLQKELSCFKMTGRRLNTKGQRFSSQIQTASDNLKNKPANVVGANSNCLKISDSLRHVTRIPSSTSPSMFSSPSNYSMCCFNQPLDPLNPKFYVKIQKNPSKRGIWLGVCVGQIVHKSKYVNCNGYKQGTYAIDQNGSGGGDNLNNPSNATVWNHSIQSLNYGGGFNNFNSNNQQKIVNIGWQFKQDDILFVEVDYFASKIRFSLMDKDGIKNGEDGNVNDLDPNLSIDNFILKSFEMPIKLNQLGSDNDNEDKAEPQSKSPFRLFPFVGMNPYGVSGDQVSILQQEEVKIMYGVGTKDHQEGQEGENEEDEDEEEENYLPFSSDSDNNNDDDLFA